ncbi:MAG: nucleotidyltransferase family protein, partial [Tissierellia bacterium]|nr:nucleotidyltransferase family protein [Tissierellia bacterium]
MNVTGIIAEYNPFHKGHEYQIKKARELSNCDGLAVVMSGNYVQRGEPALIDKYK